MGEIPTPARRHLAKTGSLWGTKNESCRMNLGWVRQESTNVDIMGVKSPEAV